MWKLKKHRESSCKVPTTKGQSTNTFWINDTRRRFKITRTFQIWLWWKKCTLHFPAVFRFFFCCGNSQFSIILWNLSMNSTKLVEAQLVFQGLEHEIKKCNEKKKLKEDENMPGSNWFSFLFLNQKGKKVHQVVHLFPKMAGMLNVSKFEMQVATNFTYNPGEWEQSEKSPTSDENPSPVWNSWTWTTTQVGSLTSKFNNSPLKHASWKTIRLPLFFGFGLFSFRDEPGR